MAGTDDKHTFSSGASSSGQKPRYDLIPSWALARIAARFEIGAKKYGENNWQKGVNDRAFILDRLNHAIEHLSKVAEDIHAGKPFPESFGSGGDPDNLPDDDLAGVILNSIFLMGYQRANQEIPF